MTGKIGPAITSVTQLARSRLLALGVGALAWALASLISAAQGQLVAAYHNRPQDWWATLGYTAAIFSIWALLAPAVFKMADALYSSWLRRGAATLLWMLGYVATTAIHLILFVAVFWPIYGSQAPTPLAMAKAVLLANLDTSAFAYAALTAAAYLRWRLRERVQASREADAAGTDEQGLWIKVAGGSYLLPFQDIDWIAAAGDYAEIHAGRRRLLTDRSLVMLVEQLPKEQFARIHRSAIVRLDRVREVRRLGRGDAQLMLCTGQVLRLSRRYRENVSAHLTI